MWNQWFTVWAEKFQIKRNFKFIWGLKITHVDMTNLTLNRRRSISECRCKRIRLCSHHSMRSRRSGHLGSKKSTPISSHRDGKGLWIVGGCAIRPRNKLGRWYDVRPRWLVSVVVVRGLSCERLLVFGSGLVEVKPIFGEKKKVGVSGKGAYSCSDLSA